MYFECKKQYFLVFWYTEQYVKGKDDMFKLGIEELLWNNQIKKVGVFSSGIPIRKYN